jgi:hypothetical protein
MNNNHNKFIIYRNIVHFSNIKSKRIIYSILASEVYNMVISIIIAYTIASMLQIITIYLNLLYISTTVCTNSYLLYKYLMKLKTIKEKWLMINIIVLYQSYEYHKLHEVYWIHGDDNLTNALIKDIPNQFLK